MRKTSVQYNYKQYMEGDKMARIDVRDLTNEQIEKLDKQVALLGLKNRSDYIRLMIELDSASGLIKLLKGDKK